MPFHNKSNNAGAKVINYYIKQFSSISDTSVLLTSNDDNSDVEKMIMEGDGINFITNFKRKNIFNRFIDGIIKYRILYPILMKFIPSYYRTNGTTKERLVKLLNNIEQPELYDIVIVEFPPLVLQSKVIKDFFPNAKLIASIHDVSFQSLSRSISSRKIWISDEKYVRQFKKFEISQLNNFDLIVSLSDKDSKLIETEISESTPIITISPYYDTYTYRIDKPDGIFFFGAMNRKENSESVKWFLKNVWQGIGKLLPDLKFYIIGGGVSAEFRNFCEQYTGVNILGFIDDPTFYFNKCYAMVIPLMYGAGIKIKTIESFVSGIPLICNAIAIEGIPAQREKDYMHCETPEEWTEAILQLVGDENLRKTLSKNGEAFALNYFNLEKSFSLYTNCILS